MEFLMMVSEVLEQSVILRPIAANFVWLKVGATRCIECWRFDKAWEIFAQSPGEMVDRNIC